MESLAILVQTRDKYHDLWNPFYFLFNKYWSDCPYTVYHVSETKKWEGNGKHVNNISTGINKDWSERLLFALDYVGEDYVLLLLDDYFLINTVQNERIEDSLEILKTNSKAGCLRIFPVPGPDFEYPGNKNIGVVDKNQPYSISTQATIWRKEILRGFLIPTENIWQFELVGSLRAKNSDFEILSLKINHIKYAEDGNYPYTYLCTAVYKGKWMREAINLAKKEKLNLDLTYRKVESRFERMYRLKYNSMPTGIKHIMDFLKSRSAR